MRDRHNAVLQRLVRGTWKEGKDIFVENAFSPDKLRPDLVVVDHRTRHVAVIDVTISYEAGEGAFEKARAEKTQKYDGLRRWFEEQPQYASAEVHALVVGSLGSWDPENLAALRALDIPPSYATLLSRLCAVDVIKKSRDIWVKRV